MRIGVLSDCLVPTRVNGGHGLGRVAIDICEGLKSAGHDPVLFGAKGSKWRGESINYDDDLKRADDIAEAYHLFSGFIDLSRNYSVSERLPDVPIVHYVMDYAVKYAPRNAIIANEGQRWAVPNARVVPLGIPVDLYPFYNEFDDYVLFAAKIHANKGYDVALTVAGRSDEKLLMVGVNLTDVPMQAAIWRDEVKNNRQFWKILGRAKALIYPARKDAGSRVILESAAVGTPVLTMDWTNTQYHVKHGVTGFICRDADEMVEAMQDIQRLDRKHMREWVQATHSRSQMVSGLIDALRRVKDGESW